jgi:hypothetical protein
MKLLEEEGRQGWFVRCMGKGLRDVPGFIRDDGA